MADVTITKVNNTYIKASTNPGIKLELAEAFTFRVEGFMFTPAYKSGRWDGKIRLLNSMSGHIYFGLLHRLLSVIEDMGYSAEVDPQLTDYTDVPDDYVHTLMDEINTPKKYTLRDYQNTAVLNSIRLNRTVIESSTGSGKSFMMYLLSRHHMKFNRKILIVVPTIDLVNQMNIEFTNYNNGTPLDTHLITAGVSKESDADIVITTWQSIQNMDSEYFNQYQVFFGDEAHQYNSNAKKIISIMEKAGSVAFRYGTTGTVDDKKLNVLTLEGLFGKILKVTDTKELIDRGTLSDFRIKATVLKYPEDISKVISGLKYADEIKWLLSCKARNKFLINLTKSIEGNTLLMFNHTKHGTLLYDSLKDLNTHKVFLVHGKLIKDTRKKVMIEILEAISKGDKPVVIVASSGVFSTGINIPELDNIIFAHPTKSRRINLQSIGRVLRKAEGKVEAVLYDIVDDMRYRKRSNFAYKHFMERYRIYKDQGFQLSLYEFKL